MEAKNVQDGNANISSSPGHCPISWSGDGCRPIRCSCKAFDLFKPLVDDYSIAEYSIFLVWVGDVFAPPPLLQF